MGYLVPPTNDSNAQAAEALLAQELTKIPICLAKIS
jgi:hypothetical protein